jgi:hypothetical protein
MFASSHASVLFDYFRIPYRVELGAIPPELGPTHPGRLWCWHSWRSPDGRDRRIAWPRASAKAGAPLHRLNGVPFFAELVVDDLFREWRQQVGRAWRPLAPIVDARGKTRGTIWQDDNGTTLLPFDPDAALTNAWTERYREASPGVGRGARQFARSAYHQMRPLVPLRRAEPVFPRWPHEPALRELCDWLLDRLADVAGEPVPYVAPWPNGCRWALVLTGDVLKQRAIRRIEPLRMAIETAGYRAAWFFAPARAVPDEGLVASLRAGGHELGVLGLKHDGRDLDRTRLAQRLPLMRRFAIRWGAIGFRAPGDERDAAILPRLGFDYDSSYPDTTPRGRGTGAWLPFANGQQIELPRTMPDDRAVFGRMRGRDDRLWSEKASWLREQGGLALMTVHPDFVGTLDRTAALERFLWQCAADHSLWRALPREVADWWRARSASRIVRDGRRWKVVGPAAGSATIRVVAPKTTPVTASA